MNHLSEPLIFRTHEFCEFFFGIFWSLKGSMGRLYIYTYMKTHKIEPNVGKYTIHGMGMDSIQNRNAGFLF